MTHLQLQKETKVLDIRIISADNRCVSFEVSDDLSVTVKVPVGMSLAMAERYIHMHADKIWQEYEKLQTRNHQALPVTLELEDGRVQYYSGQILPFLGSMNLELRVRYLSQGEETKLYVEKRAEGGQILTIRTDNIDQRFLRYCVMCFYKKCAAGIISRRTAQLGQRMHLKFQHVQIAGKTGTAQIHQGKAGYKGNIVRHRVSFCGYFPAENPKYSGIVVVSAPRVGYPSGGTMPGAVLRTVAEEMYARGFLPGEGTVSRDTVFAKMPAIKKGNLENTTYVCRHLSLPYTSPESVGGGEEWVSVKSKDYTIAMDRIEPNRYTVPSVVGMGARDAIYLLEKVGLRVSVEGRGKVVRQSIPVGRRVSRGERITIVLK